MRSASAYLRGLSADAASHRSNSAWSCAPHSGEESRATQASAVSVLDRMIGAMSGPRTALRIGQRGAQQDERLADLLFHGLHRYAAVAGDLGVAHAFDPVQQI